jgi:hypothetical protein
LQQMTGKLQHTVARINACICSRGITNDLLVAAVCVVCSLAAGSSQQQAWGQWREGGKAMAPIDREAARRLLHERR